MRYVCPHFGNLICQLQSANQLKVLEVVFWNHKPFANESKLRMESWYAVCLWLLQYIITVYDPLLNASKWNARLNSWLTEYPHRSALRRWRLYSQARNHSEIPQEGTCQSQHTRRNRLRTSMRLTQQLLVSKCSPFTEIASNLNRPWVRDEWTSRDNLAHCKDGERTASKSRTEH